MKVRRSSVLSLIAPFAPPLTGQTAYSAHLRGVLEPHGFETMAVPGRDARDGLRGYVRKAVASFGVLRRLLFGAPRETVVLVLDGGVGLVLDLLYVLCARVRGTRAIALSHHSFAYVTRRSFWLWSLLRVAPRDTTIHLFLCEQMRAQFVLRYGPVRSRVLSNAAAVVTTPVPAARDGVFRLGYLSNITFEKGIEAYFDLVEALVARGVDVRGCIAGPAGSDAVATFLAQRIACSGGRVSWLGPLYGAEKDRFLSSISVLVFPTDYVNEAQPIVLFEALAHGVPVVTIGRGCIRGDMEGSGSLVAGSASMFLEEAVPFVQSLAERYRRGETGTVASLATARYLQARVASQAAEAALIAELSASAARERGRRSMA